MLNIVERDFRMPVRLNNKLQNIFNWTSMKNFVTYGLQVNHLLRSIRLHVPDLPDRDGSIPIPRETDLHACILPDDGRSRVHHSGGRGSWGDCLWFLSYQRRWRRQWKSVLLGKIVNSLVTRNPIDINTREFGENIFLCLSTLFCPYLVTWSVAILR